MRTITLELLRHGPAHNQLLSPLTPYMALCENHGAVTVHVPCEHNQFLFRLSALDYKSNEDARLFQLNDTARLMGELLAMIPGLTAESNKDDDTAEPLTHLRLLLSASELALLPFELAFSPNGFPGAGQYLLLQPQTPICMTRETRRVADKAFQWPEKPRVLFVAASPPGVGTIPLESHLLALRRLVSPWIKYYDEDDTENRRKRVEESFVLLPEASIEAIETACANNRFTHIHILAHGVERKEGFDSRFFLALHDARDPEGTDYISGERLATALRATHRPDSQGLAQPAVVTLASCNSASNGSVVGAGASIAHALHEAGIPMVVAGQFPLSFEGSVCLVECLYEGLLWGTDPRRLLYDLRRRLYAQFPDRHDWASLSAYISLPDDFDSQLANVRIERVVKSIDAAMNHADEVTRSLYSEKGEKLEETSKPKRDERETGQLLDDALGRIAVAKERLAHLLDCLPDQKFRIHGSMASTAKRQGEALYCAATVPKKSPDLKKLDPKKLTDSDALLSESRDHYWESFLLNRSSSWALVQYLSLTLVMQHSDRFPELGIRASKEQGPADPVPPKMDLEALWSMAHLLSHFDLRSKERMENIWAYSNLIELYLIAPAIPPGNKLPTSDAARKAALEHTDALIDLAGRSSFEVYSTRRQIFRYRTWFNSIAPKLAESLAGVADEIFAKFPKGIEDKWK
jgi:hypothetical protein